MSTLLLDSRPLVVLPELACAIGLNEAIVVQQVHYWLEINRKNRHNFKDGRYWVYNSFQEWQKQFPWWPVVTIKRIIGSLEKKGILMAGNYNTAKFDRTKWYSIDYDKLHSILPSYQNDTMESIKMTTPIPETNITEIKDNGNNGTMVSTDKSVSTVTIDELDADVSGFIRWYFDYYQSMTGERHPPIRTSQKKRIHSVLKDFCLEYCIESDGLQAMAEAFFNVGSSDHNINHFATAGILENRFYEELY